MHYQTLENRNDIEKLINHEEKETKEYYKKNFIRLVQE